MSAFIFLRCFAEAPDSQAASAIGERLRNMLEPALPGVLVTAILPYWKIPEYQEICLEAPDGSEVRAVAQVLGNGWLFLNDDEAIWSGGSESSIVEPNIRWAHLERIKR